MSELPVAVIGGGQAGLATSWWLKQLEVEHVVLEKGRVGDSWRRRWDSFCLVTPNWTLRLPGFPYEGTQPDGFLPRDQIVAYLERYRDSFDPPIQSPVEVERLGPDDGSWLLSTSAGDLRAGDVVVATGSFQRPFVPRGAQDIPGDILQLHSQDYRNPESLPEGAVLVVGSAQSGCQIVDDLRLAGREVWLSVSSAGRAPRRYRGRETTRWLDAMGFADRPVDELPDGEAARFRANPHLSGRDGGKDLNLRVFGRDGVRLVGRFGGAEGTRLHFADDLIERLDGADRAADEMKHGIDEFIAATGVDAPPDDSRPVDWVPDRILEEVDYQEEGIRSIVWATGYRLDFSWIDAPVFAERGYPNQQRGITEAPGLCFVGLNAMHTVGSGLFWGVGADAEHLARHIAAKI